MQFGGQWGYYTDASTGEVNLTHRYYDPATGHFLNRDPIGYNGGQNLYAFCGNNPITGSDPNGTDAYVYLIYGATSHKGVDKAIDDSYGTHAFVAVDMKGGGVMMASYAGTWDVGTASQNKPYGPIDPAKISDMYGKPGETLVYHAYRIKQSAAQDSALLDKLLTDLRDPVDGSSVTKAKLLADLGRRGADGRATFNSAGGTEVAPVHDCSTEASRILEGGVLSRFTIRIGISGAPSDLDTALSAMTVSNPGLVTRYPHK